MKKIKYDQRDKKRSLVLAIIFTAFAFAALFLAVWEPEVSAEMGAWLILFIVIAPIWCVSCWIHFIDICFYLKRLTKYGYEIPRRKGEYGADLNCLPRTAEERTVFGNSKESMALAALCFCCAAGFLLCTLCFLPRYSHMSLSPFSFCFGFMISAVLLWVLGGVHYWKQRIRAKYKDDVEREEQKRTRTPLVSGVVAILVLFGITVVLFYVMYQINYTNTARIPIDAILSHSR